MRKKRLITLTSCVYLTKVIFFITFALVKVTVFVPYNPFQPSLIFVSKARCLQLDLITAE
jgi:hypothetical protein